MKKAKQILALVGVILLVALYGLTIVAALFDPTKTLRYLSAAVAATILIPVTLWLLQMMIRAFHKEKEDGPKPEQ